MAFIFLSYINEYNFNITNKHNTNTIQTQLRFYHIIIMNIITNEKAMSIIQKHKDLDFLTDVLSLWFKVQRDVFHFENMQTFEKMKESAAKLTMTYMAMNERERKEYYNEFKNIYSQLYSLSSVTEEPVWNKDEWDSWNNVWNELTGFDSYKDVWFDTNVWDVKDGEWWDQVWDDLNESSEEKMVWNNGDY